MKKQISTIWLCTQVFGDTFSPGKNDCRMYVPCKASRVATALPLGPSVCHYWHEMTSKVRRLQTALSLLILQGNTPFPSNITREYLHSLPILQRKTLSNSPKFRTMIATCFRKCCQGKGALTRTRVTTCFPLLFAGGQGERSTKGRKGRVGEGVVANRGAPPSSPCA